MGTSSVGGLGVWGRDTHRVTVDHVGWLVCLVDLLGWAMVINNICIYIN
jgi:hypothetical protein